MRLHVEITPLDIEKAQTHRHDDCPIYHAIVRQTGCPNVEIARSALIVHWGQRRYWGRGLDYALPAEVAQRVTSYYRDPAIPRKMESFEFDIELDRRGVKLLGLNRPCSRCGDYPCEQASDVCIVCRKYRETMLALWR